MTLRDGHAIPPKDLQERVDAILPDGERSAAVWVAGRTGYSANHWYQCFGGHCRVTERMAAALELLEENHRLRDGTVAERQGPIERRLRRFRDDLEEGHREFLKHLAPMLRRWEELIDECNRALGE